MGTTLGLASRAAFNFQRQGFVPSRGGSTMKILLRNTIRFVLIVGLAVLTTCSSPTPDDRQSLVQQARTALDDLNRRVPAAKAVGDKSRAILVFPTVTEGGFIVGGGYGRGVLFERGRPVAYYSVGGASIGFQAGAQTHSEAYFFTTEQAYQDFRKSKGFELGAGVDFAVADVGGSGEISTATINKPIVVFVWGTQGLMAGVKIEGRVLTRLDD
jgi:lipid-binding SYLF domain-containing protein